jgi:transposase
MANHYTKEFREEAVRLVLDSEKKVSQIAKDLGVNHWTLRDWVQQHRDKTRKSEPQSPETLEAENRRLKRELSVLKQEREILKKAAAYFAKEQF